MSVEKVRRERDSNPRSGDRKAVFKTAAFNHSAIPPQGFLFYPQRAGAASRRFLGPETLPQTLILGSTHPIPSLYREG